VHPLKLLHSGALAPDHCSPSAAETQQAPLRFATALRYQGMGVPLKS